MIKTIFLVVEANALHCYLGLPMLPNQRDALAWREHDMVHDDGGMEWEGVEGGGEG